MIEVRNITKSFDGRTVLHGVSATFETGKTNLIIGQSGSGKTVLMKSLVGLLQPEKEKFFLTAETYCRCRAPKSTNSAKK